MTPIKIDKAQNTPVYLQIVNAVVSHIQDGSLSLGSQLSSINQIANDYGLARETVVKAFKILQEKGIVSPVQGKGYFVSSVDFSVTNRIFLLFDSFSAYKEVIYNALKDRFGVYAFIDIYFHHYNLRTFEKLVRDNSGNYQAYIIIPFENVRYSEVLKTIPSEKLYLLDRYVPNSIPDMKGIFQDFETDIFEALTETIDLCRKYKRLILVFRNQITDPPEGLLIGFTRFCKVNQFDSQIIRTSLSKRKLKKGEAYIVIDDEDLVYLVENTKVSGLIPGIDLGIISYNETPLKKIAANGISVISTDFAEMGRSMADMVINKQKHIKYNPFRFINRMSF